MIERQTINGRAATVGYLDHGFSPAAKDSAQFVKVHFDDGELLFLSTGLSVPPETEAEFSPAEPGAPKTKPQRALSPHNTAVKGFTVAINEAEKHRRVLKKRFGYTDPQIGTMVKTLGKRLTAR